jgi:hypothetical protein
MAKSNSKIVVLDPMGQPSGIFGRRLNADLPMFAIHDPVHQTKDTAENLNSMKMTERLDTLEGKTVYLVNVTFPGSREFLEELQDWFSKNRPDIKTVLRDKKLGWPTDEPELWQEIKENGDAVVFGVGG